MSDDEGRLLIDDIQDCSGSVDHEHSASTLVEIKSVQGDAENTSINKLSTPLTVPVFGQPQVTSSGELNFHSSTPTNVQRLEPTSFAYSNSLGRVHIEHETSIPCSIATSKHKRRSQPESNASLFTYRSDSNHSILPTPRSSMGSYESGSLQSEGSANGKRQKRYKTNGMAKSRSDTSSSRKRKDSDHIRPDSPTEHDETISKKYKPPQRSRGTNVQSKAVQSDTDGSLFDLEVGATRLIEMTVVCKMENNALYVVAKWKDQELTGILTDGQPPAFQPYIKKRSALSVSSSSNSSNGSACGDQNERATNSGASTPSKSRQLPTTPRDSKKRAPVGEAKRKLSCSMARPGSSMDPPEEEEEVEMESYHGGSISNPDVYKLVEVPGKKYMHVCMVDGCQHRYTQSEDMEFHKATMHAKKAVMYEAICCQTDISSFRRRSVETDVEGLAQCEPASLEVMEEPTIKNECAASCSAESESKLEHSSKSPAGYSDISDDGDAPQLQKEEPTTDVRGPLLISTGLPNTSVSGPANILTSPEFAPSPREVPSQDSIPPTPQQVNVPPSSPIPIDCAAALPMQSSFQPVSAERNRGTIHGTGLSPVLNVAATPTSISALPATARLPVTPSAGGMYMPSFAHQMMPPYAPQLAAPTPSAPSPQQTQQQQQQHLKISQQHMKAPDDIASQSGAMSAPKTMQSPAAQSLQRPFGLPMMQTGTGQHQAAMMQAAAAQAQMAQMHHLYMQQMAAGARGAQYSMAGSSAGSHEMAQLVALQALQQQQQSHFANMFQQK